VRYSNEAAVQERQAMSDLLASGVLPLALISPLLTQAQAQDKRILTPTGRNSTRCFERTRSTFELHYSAGFYPNKLIKLNRFSTKKIKQSSKIWTQLKILG